jgi:hypothetical protein
MDRLSTATAHGETARRRRVSLRRLHSCAGALFAPALLFFAVSGLVQVFDLHKASPGAGASPPAVVRAMAQLHKKQTLTRAENSGSRPAPGGGRRAAPAPASASLGQRLLKAYAAATSVVLALTTLAGLVLALRNRRDRALTLALLVLGIVAPLGLLLLG